MVTYGQHADLVQEVIDFACTGTPLLNPLPLDSENVIWEYDFQAALDWARNQGQEDEDEESDDDWLTWEDIRSQELSQFYLTAPQASADKELNSAIRDAGQVIRQCLKNNLSQAYEMALNDVDGDMSSCVRSRAYVGLQNPFFERLFRLYKAGYWPCGWEGNYPDGKLVVFVPGT